MAALHAPDGVVIRACQVRAHVVGGSHPEKEPTAARGARPDPYGPEDPFGQEPARRVRAQVEATRRDGGPEDSRDVSRVVMKPLSSRAKRSTHPNVPAIPAIPSPDITSAAPATRLVTRPPAWARWGTRL